VKNNAKDGMKNNIDVVNDNKNNQKNEQTEDE
jgi:hypothetical protein